jgi:hypothetical protein
MLWNPRRICWVNRTRLCIYFSDNLRGWRESGSTSNTLYLWRGMVAFASYYSYFILFTVQNSNMWDRDAEKHLLWRIIVPGDWSSFRALSVDRRVRCVFVRSYTIFRLENQTTQLYHLTSTCWRCQIHETTWHNRIEIWRFARNFFNIHTAGLAFEPRTSYETRTRLQIQKPDFIFDLIEVLKSSTFHSWCNEPHRLQLEQHMFLLITSLYSARRPKSCRLIRNHNGWSRGSHLCDSLWRTRPEVLFMG